MERSAGQYLWQSLENVIGGLQSRRLADVFRFVSFTPSETYGPDSHLRIEINYVRKGTCTLHLGDDQVSFREGEIMVIAPHVEHIFEAGPAGATLMQLEFLPEILSRFGAAGSGMPGTLFPDGSPLLKIVNNIRIMRVIQRIVSELETQGEHYRYLVVMYYAELLVLIHRCIDEASLPQCGDQRLKQAVAYLRLHYQSDISVSALAAQAGVGERHLRKLFARYLRHSPADFLNRIRIEKAVELLRNTDLSVKEICFACGFRSPQYFSRIFKRQTGASPREIAR